MLEQNLHYVANDFETTGRSIVHNACLGLKIPEESIHSVVEALCSDPEGQAAMATPDHHGFTPPHCASHAGHTGALVALMAAKANITGSRTSQDDTPLHLASMGGHVDVVRMLLEAKADVGARNAAKWTPLHLAILQGQVKITLMDEHFECHVFECIVCSFRSVRRTLKWRSSSSMRGQAVPPKSSTLENGLFSASALTTAILKCYPCSLVRWGLR